MNSLNLLKDGDNIGDACQAAKFARSMWVRSHSVM